MKTPKNGWKHATENEVSDSVWEMIASRTALNKKAIGAFAKKHNISWQNMGMVSHKNVQDFVNAIFCDDPKLITQHLTKKNSLL